MLKVITRRRKDCYIILGNTNQFCCSIQLCLITYNLNSPCLLLRMNTKNSRLSWFYPKEYEHLINLVFGMKMQLTYISNSQNNSCTNKKNAWQYKHPNRILKSAYTEVKNTSNTKM